MIMVLGTAIDRGYIVFIGKNKRVKVVKYILIASEQMLFCSRLLFGYNSLAIVFHCKMCSFSTFSVRNEFNWFWYMSFQDCRIIQKSHSGSNLIENECF